MDYSIRRVESPTVRPVGPRSKQGEQPPFEFEEDDAPAHPDEKQRRPEPDTTSRDRAIAPPDEDEAGSHLDLSA